MLMNYMEKQTNPCAEMEKETLKQGIKQRKARLAEQQLLLKQNRLPVIVLVEGWGAAGKGSRIGKMIESLDPRFFHVVSVNSPTEEEKRRPFLWRYFTKIPEAGKFLFLDSGWMDETVRQQLKGDLDEEAYQQRLKSIHIFERQLADNGYLLIKVFLHISQKEQSRRLDELAASKGTNWRVSDNDIWQNKHYETCLAAFDHYLKATNTPGSPWEIIDSTKKSFSEFAFYDLLTRRIDEALTTKASNPAIIAKRFPLLPTPSLSEISLDKRLTDETYDSALKAAQKRLRSLHNLLYREKIPLIIVYEGWDAAGKGGNIKRLTSALDPRGYEVFPIASPEPQELARHYLWRFWNRLPKTGHIAIFDRSWYGRVMVERIEGFCSANDWQRAYTEINEFEKELSNWGAVILKFWLQIDKDTQLSRFTERQNTPEKQWKITEEDWRNREKWDAYETAVNEMLQKTNTVYAPWHIIESTDKKYARIKALNLVIDSVERALAQKD